LTCQITRLQLVVNWSLNYGPQDPKSFQSATGRMVVWCATHHCVVEEDEFGRLLPCPQTPDLTDRARDELAFLGLMPPAVTRHGGST
jgi:hypothetical protein